MFTEQRHLLREAERVYDAERKRVPTVFQYDTPAPLLLSIAQRIHGSLGTGSAFPGPEELAELLCEMFDAYADPGDVPRNG